METSRSVNHPFGRNQDLVWTAEAGIMKNEPRPTERVIMPSMRKSQRQPAQLCTPSRWKMAKARREVTIPVTERVAQKKLLGC